MLSLTAPEAKSIRNSTDFSMTRRGKDYLLLPGITLSCPRIGARYGIGRVGFGPVGVGGTGTVGAGFGAE